MTSALPNGRGFLQRVVVLSYVYSVGALALVLPALYAVLDITSAQWWWFLGCAGAYTVVVTPLQTVLQRRIFGAIPEWLDECASGGARGADAAQRAQRAFADVVDLPRRSALMGVAGWAVPVSLLTVAMSLRWESWGLFQSVAVLSAGYAAGCIAGVFLLFAVKGVCAPVREALAAEVDDPALRGALVRPTSLRLKLGASVTTLAAIPVVFAGLLFHVLAERSLERFTTRWQQDVLEGGGLTVGPAPEGAAAASLADVLEIASLDPAREGDAGPLEPTVWAELRRDVAGGRRAGTSLGLPSARVFAWRLDGEGRVELASVPRERIAVDMRPMWMTLAALLSATGLASLGLALLLAGDVSRAARWLREEAERLAAGDLRAGRAFDSEDELGEVARAFASMTGSLRATVGGMMSAADTVEATAAGMADVAASVSSVTADQVQGIRRTAAAVEQVDRQVGGIADSASALNVSVEESSSSILELGAAGEELNDTASALSERVNEVSSSIEQMVRSVRQVVENTEALSQAAVETSGSMGEMASSMREVDSAAEETAGLSRRVIEAAESGQAKMVQTIGGMDEIREATETAERVIRSLGNRASEIGAVVDVIDDVADETNLLALNAAIIAAQAGEHGRAFSVVADEIKDLADRVLASTKEIGGLVRAVQAESANAIGAIEKGSQSVASGVDLAAEAGMSLEEITTASRDSGRRISGIVAAVREQARAAGHVVQLMERVRSGVEQIRAAAEEQDRGNEVVYRGAVAMREVAQQVRGTTEEQARGSGRIRESVEGVREAVEQIGGALREQSTASRSAVELLEGIQERTRSNEESAQRLDEVARDLLAQAEALRRDVLRFQL